MPWIMPVVGDVVCKRTVDNAGGGIRLSGVVDALPQAARITSTLFAGLDAVEPMQADVAAAHPAKRPKRTLIGARFARTTPAPGLAALN